jgi:hypothetical protein
MGRVSTAADAVAVGCPDDPMARTTRARPMAARAATQMTAILAGFIQSLRQTRSREPG